MKEKRRKQLLRIICRLLGNTINIVSLYVNTIPIKPATPNN